MDHQPKGSSFHKHSHQLVYPWTINQRQQFSQAFPSTSLSMDHQPKGSSFHKHSHQLVYPWTINQKAAVFTSIPTFRYTNSLSANGSSDHFYNSFSLCCFLAHVQPFNTSTNTVHGYLCFFCNESPNNKSEWLKRANEDRKSVTV